MNLYQDTAKKLIQARQQITNYVPSGYLREVLGQDGYNVALLEKWIIPDYDSGNLNFAQEDRVLSRMIRIAEGAEYAPGQSVVVGGKGPDGKPSAIKATVKARSNEGKYRLVFPAGCSQPDRDYDTTELAVDGVAPGSNTNTVNKPNPVATAP